jgi:hypothetical protein
LLVALLLQDTAENGMDLDTAAAGSFQYLLALHALTAADPSLAAPAADAQRYVRLLTPYTASLASAGVPQQAGRVSSGGLWACTNVMRTSVLWY